jgi:hypothetical protein
MENRTESAEGPSEAVVGSWGTSQPASLVVIPRTAVQPGSGMQASAKASIQQSQHPAGLHLELHQNYPPVQDKVQNVSSVQLAADNMSTSQGLRSDGSVESMGPSLQQRCKPALQTEQRQEPTQQQSLLADGHIDVPWGPASHPEKQPSQRHAPALDVASQLHVRGGWPGGQSGTASCVSDRQLSQRQAAQVLPPSGPDISAVLRALHEHTPSERDAREIACPAALPPTPHAGKAASSVAAAQQSAGPSAAEPVRHAEPVAWKLNGSSTRPERPVLELQKGGFVQVSGSGAGSFSISRHSDPAVGPISDALRPQQAAKPHILAVTEAPQHHPQEPGLMPSQVGSGIHFASRAAGAQQAGAFPQPMQFVAGSHVADASESGLKHEGAPEQSPGMSKEPQPPLGADARSGQAINKCQPAQAAADSPGVVSPTPTPAKVHSCAPPLGIRRAYNHLPQDGRKKTWECMHNLLASVFWVQGMVSSHADYCHDISLAGQARLVCFDVMVTCCAAMCIFLVQEKGGIASGVRRHTEIKAETDAGTVVWAKSPRYPWWPAQVTRSSLPAH